MHTDSHISGDKPKRRQPSRPHAQPAPNVSQHLAAESRHTGSVHVDISISPSAVEGLARSLGRAKAKALPDVTTEAVREALRAAAADFFARSFADEIGRVVDAYRLMLRESLAKGGNPELLAALNRARLQEKILASTTMVDQAQACELLGLSGANPSATMKRKEDKREVLRFTVDGRAAYPLFQFDVEGRRIFPAMADIAAKKPKDWSDFRVLHWLTRPHLDIDGTPADALGTDGDAVTAAFAREVEPTLHG